MPKIECKCLQCGKKFYVFPSLLKHRHGNYCSRACYYKYRPKLITGKNNPRWKPFIKHICQQCDKEFEVTPSRHEKGNGKYCSVDCHNESMTKQVECVCLNCGKTFYRKKSRTINGLGKYCSKKCSFADKNKDELTIC